MKISICHYSFHRRYVDEGWDLDRLCSEVAALDVDALDFHVRYLGDIKDAAKRVSAALKNSGLKLSGLSLSTNFNVPDKEKFQEEIKNTKAWMQVAAQTGAPVSRIFGGGLKRLETDEKTKSEAFKRVIEALGILSETAKEIGLVLALENHGGLPCTGEEQVEMLKAVGSDFVKATIDVGNYMAGGQEGVEGTKVAKDYCAYVHFKDNKKIPDLVYRMFRIIREIPCLGMMPSIYSKSLRPLRHTKTFRRPVRQSMNSLYRHENDIRCRHRSCTTSCLS